MKTGKLAPPPKKKSKAFPLPSYPQWKNTCYTTDLRNLQVTYLRPAWILPTVVAAGSLAHDVLWRALYMSTVAFVDPDVHAPSLLGHLPAFIGYGLVAAPTLDWTLWFTDQVPPIYKGKWRTKFDKSLKVILLKPMYSFGKQWKQKFPLMGFVYRGLWVLKVLWIILSETIKTFIA